MWRLPQRRRLCHGGVQGVRHSLGLASIPTLLLVVVGTGVVYGQDGSGPDLLAAFQGAVVEAIARAEPSVVAIARVDKASPSETLNLEYHPAPFGGRSIAVPARPTDPDFIPNEYATGVVVDRQGLILTAYHVLGENSEYYVTTHDRRVFLATVKGADARSDLAVLAVQATDLEPITFGDASTLKKGQFVIALGNPYAIARDGQVSASWGIVANLARKAPPAVDDEYPSGKSTIHHFGTLIQTDAKLNLGTSGGALLNLKGEMVGLTTALAATAGYEQSAGYAFPVDETFRRVVDTLKAGREVEYGFLGVNLRPQALLKGLDGALIERVVAGMPGDRVGLQPGDIITSVNGKPIHDTDGLMLEVSRLPVNAKVRLAVVRGERRLDLDVGLTKLNVRGKQIVTAPAPSWRGMRVDYPSAVFDPLSGERPSGLDFDAGVIVTDVEGETPAWQAGLRPGMLVSHVGQAAVHTPREFQAAVAGKTGPVQLRLTDLDGRTPPQATVRGS